MCVQKSTYIVESIGLNSSLVMYKNRDEPLTDETAG